MLFAICRSDSQAICGGNTATHTGRNGKSSLKLKWKAPESPTTVEFSVTTLQTLSKFWLGQPGSTLLEVQPNQPTVCHF